VTVLVLHFFSHPQLSLQTHSRYNHNANHIRFIIIQHTRTICTPSSPSSPFWAWLLLRASPATPPLLAPAPAPLLVQPKHVSQTVPSAMSTARLSASTSLHRTRHKSKRQTNARGTSALRETPDPKTPRSTASAFRLAPATTTTLAAALPLA